MYKLQSRNVFSYISISLLMALFLIPSSSQAFDLGGMINNAENSIENHIQNKVENQATTAGDNAFDSAENHALSPHTDSKQQNQHVRRFQPMYSNESSRNSTSRPNNQSYASTQSTFKVCFERCRQYTNRTKGQCFDVCNKSGH